MGIHSHPAVYGPLLGYEPGFVPLPAPTFFWIGISLVAVMVIFLIWIFTVEYGFKRKSMSRQEIFDHVSSNLLKQGAQSRSASGCAYRGTDGGRCAIGWLIPDEEYRKSMEDHSFVSEELRPVLEKRIGRKLREKDIQLLQSLLLCHDTTRFTVWPEQLHQVAVTHGLRP